MPYYAVAKGRSVGIFYSWKQCQPEVNRYSGALYRRFERESDAENFLKNHLPYDVFLEIIGEENLFSRDANDYIEIFTDGACLRNGRMDALASIGVFFADNHPENVSRITHKRRTNIGAEIEAVLAAVSIIDRYQLNDVIIYTDCLFIAKGLNHWMRGWIRRGWRTTNGSRVSYKKEFQFLAAKMSHWSIRIEHVRGHCGIYGNEQADKLAKQALNEFIC